MKYIMFDLDDTLLNDKREITPYTVAVMEKLRAMGHKLVYNTARSKDFVQKYFAILPPDYAILNGGAMIMNASGETIWLSELDVPTTRALLLELVGLTDAIYVQTVEEFFSHKGRKSFQPHISIDFRTEDFCQSAQKIVTEIPDDEKAAELAEKYGTSMTAVALAWLLTKVTAPVVGMTKPHHVDGAVKAAGLTLSKEDCAYLEEPYVPHALVGVMAGSP